MGYQTSDMKRRVLDLRRDMLDMQREIWDVRREILDMKRRILYVRREILDLSVETSDGVERKQNSTGQSGAQE